MCILSQVRATDNGSPPRHTDHSLTINILDVNDNAPVIESQKGYNVSISEVGPHSESKICTQYLKVYHLCFFTERFFIHVISMYSPHKSWFMFVSICLSLLYFCSNYL